MANLKPIQRYFREHLHVRFVARDSPEFQDLRAAYIENLPIVPLGIARPQTAEDVASVIRYIAKEGIKFSIRAGGHDLYGRSFVQDGIVIDMRDISYVQVDESRGVAQVGGGTLACSVAKALSDKGMATALGSFPTVGYAGWATHGGYGPFAPNYGLGVDQIVGARLVNWEGQIVDADEGMLKALRGGGGALGVIVELTVKIYPLRQVLAGVILFESNDIDSTIRKIINGLSHLRTKGLPAELGLQQSVVNTPHGKVLAIGFMWSSDDMERGQSYLQQVLDFGEVIHNSVIPTNLGDWLEESGRLPPSSAFGAICSARVRVQTDQIADILAKFAKSMPEDRGTLYCVHEIRGPSTKPCSNSIFRTRECHFLIECIGTAVTAEAAPISWQWALQLRHAIMQTEPANILPGSYLPLNPPDEFSFDEVYGEHWREFQELKKKYDPQNVFENALPKFGSSDHV